jgi:hypothetical protein
VLIVYPILKERWSLPDTILAGFGLFTKIVSLVVLAFVFTNWMAFSTTALLAFNRFVSTGMRAVCSHLVDLNEQGTTRCFM